MKPGALVMLISHGGSEVVPGFPNIGAVGEVQDPISFAQEIPTDIPYTVVTFPRHPSRGKRGVWYVPTSWLIPISDPDIDLTEETEDNLNEELVTQN